MYDLLSGTCKLLGRQKEVVGWGIQNEVEHPLYLVSCRETGIMNITAVPGYGSSRLLSNLMECVVCYQPVRAWRNQELRQGLSGRLSGFLLRATETSLEYIKGLPESMIHRVC